jgi:hypothetical protein
MKSDLSFFFRVNFKARDITEDYINDKNGVMSGPSGLLKLVEEAEKVLSY